AAQYVVGVCAGPLASSRGASATAMALTMLLGALAAGVAFSAVLVRLGRRRAAVELADQFPVF
ncbi:MAG: hypothetical protein QOI26_2273, partial [Pseudonocardiales bacterium]|nr:hypothetical protein [Pseudonocardiales bacterium]